MPLPTEIVSGFQDQSLANSPTVQRYDSVDGLVKGYDELNAFMGRSIRIPPRDSQPEFYDKWLTEEAPKLKDHGFTISKLGDLPPDSPDKYDFKFDGVTPEQLKDDKILAKYKAVAHELGLNNAQASALVARFAKDLMPDMMPPPGEEIVLLQDGAVEELMTKTFKESAPLEIDTYKKSVNMLQQDIPELKDYLNESFREIEKGKLVKSGDDPVIIKLINLIGKHMQPDFAGNIQGNTPEAKNAQNEIESIMHDKNNPKNALWLKGDKATRAYVDDLWKQTTGGR